MSTIQVTRAYSNSMKEKIKTKIGNRDWKMASRSSSRFFLIIDIIITRVHLTFGKTLEKDATPSIDSCSSSFLSFLFQ